MATSVMPATEFSTLFETQKVEAKFLVPSDGDYYLGFHLLSGACAGRWPLEKILSAGYGVATYYCGDVDPDYDDSFM